MSNKTIIITGGVSGFGARLTEVLLEKGWNVVMVDRDAQRGETLAAELQKRFPKSASAKPNDPPRVSFQQCDVSKMDNIKRVFEFTESTYGGFDAVANNAGLGDADGYYVLSRLHDGTKWDTTIRVNIDAVIYGTQLAIKHFREKNKKGTVMNTASVGAWTLSSNQPIYNATKAFVQHFTRCHKHFAEHGIRVNAVAPGPSPTPMFLNGAKVPRIAASFAEMMKKIQPIDLIVEAMVRCIEDESLAGEILRADNGQIDIFDPMTLDSKVVYKL